MAFTTHIPNTYITTQIHSTVQSYSHTILAHTYPHKYTMQTHNNTLIHTHNPNPHRHTPQTQKYTHTHTILTHS